MAGKEKTFEKWCKATSCHGIIDWFESSSITAKIFWSLFLLGCLGVATWQVYELCDEFSSAPHYRTTTYSNDRGYVLFPNVTLCNYNRAHRDRAISLGMTIAENNSSKLDPDYLNYFYMSFPTYYPLDIYVDFENNGNDATTAKIKRLKEKFETWKSQSNLSHSSPIELLHKLGLTCWEMVIRCRWNERTWYDCCKYAKPIITIYGLCWSLGLHSTFIGDTGSKTGLSLITLPRIDTYTPEVIESNHVEEGLILGVNFNPYHYKVVNPIILRPGTSTTISLKNLLDIHTPPKYQIFKKGCLDNPKLMFLKGHYTKEYCIRDCMWYQINASCGCVPIAEIIRDDVVFCDGAQQVFCVTPTVETADKNQNSKFFQCRKKCGVSCEPRQSVEATVVSAKFPGQVFVKGMKDRFRDLKLSRFENATDEWINVDIYFSSLSQQVTAEYEKVPIFNLIASVGGQLGLWLGMSVVTIMQLVYYLLPNTIEKNQK